MKKVKYILLICSVLFSVCGDSHKEDGRVAGQIDSLLKAKDYFKAKRLFEKNQSNLSEYAKHLYSAKINNVFNQLEVSESSINTLLDKYPASLDNSVKSDLLEMSLENNIKLFHYNAAYQTASELLSAYKEQLDSTTIKKLKNEINMWKGLSNAPKQRVLKKEETTILLIDGFKIPLTFNASQKPTNLLFDTGANFSLVVASLVKPLGMQLLDAKFTVKSIVGQDIEAGLAIAPKLSFGNIEMAHVVFMVFPDEVLTFEEANFKINGIVGYPVIEALKEVQFKKDGVLYIPKNPTKKNFKNLALDFLTPIVEAQVGKDSLVFSFDTGADATWLYHKYYKLYKSEIEANFPKTTTKIGGLGGAKQYEAYKVNLSFKLGNSVITLDSLDTTIENVAESHEYYYGNIGQDAVKTHDNLTLNFEDMYIELANN